MHKLQKWGLFMITNAQKKAKKKYEDSHYKRITLLIPKEEAEQLENICKLHNYSKNGFIRAAVQEKIERLGEEENLQGEK